MRQPQPVPRCVPSDPQCGPEFAPYTFIGESKPWPTWRGPHGETGEKCLRPDSPRYPTFSGSLRMVDACQHDGECVIEACGNL
jgi:hypothetical protein